MERLFCNKCQTEKDINLFYRRKDTRTGRTTKCKECCRATMREYHQKNKEKRNAEKKIWYQNNREFANKQVMRWRKNNPHKVREYNMKNSNYYKYKATWHQRHPEAWYCWKEYKRALKDGVVKRGDGCAICNQVCYTEAYHKDFSKPMDILWLCKRCYCHIAKELYVNREKEDETFYKNTSDYYVSI